MRRIADCGLRGFSEGLTYNVQHGLTMLKFDYSNRLLVCVSEALVICLDEDVMVVAVASAASHDS